MRFMRKRPAPGGTWAERRFPIVLAVILLVGLIARLLYLKQVAALPFFDQPVGDCAVHLARANEIAHGALLPARPFYYCSIFYPYFLAALMGVMHASLFSVCVIQVLAGIVVCGTLALVARRLYGAEAGLATAALAALYGPSAFFEADILGVAWGQLAIAAMLLACVAWMQARKPASAPATVMLALGGLALGLACTERPNLLLVLPLLGAWCARRTGRAALALCAGAAPPLVLVLALNVAGSGAWVPLTTSAGINLSLSYHAGADGTFSEPWENAAPEFAARHTEPEEAMVAMASIQSGRTLTPQEASSYWMKRALAFIATHPGEATVITMRKALLLFNASEVPNHLDFDFIRGQAPALWLMPFGFGLILVFAAAGFAEALRGRHDRAGAVLLLLVTGGAWLGLLPFTVADRYRATLVPALLVAAGVGAVSLGRLAIAAPVIRPGTLVRRLAPAAIALLIAVLPLFRPLRGRDWWMLAQAHEKRGEADAALAAYESAAREESADGALLNNLAMAYRARGDMDHAIATLRRAVAASPGLAYPHKNLGMLLVARGAPDSALAQLQEASRIDPRDAESIGVMGALLAGRGDVAGARAAFARAHALAPDNQRLMGLIAPYERELAAKPAKRKP
jgi:tetratricopeptide (TPR) repeat protein